MRVAREWSIGLAAFVATALLIATRHGLIGAVPLA